MRKIVAGLFMSMDGVVERPEQWTGAHFNDEIGQLVGSLIAGGDTLLLGRRTYQEFAEAFGGATGDDPMAPVMNNFPKVVVSTTLEKAEWQNSTLINRDVAREIVKLKQQPGGNINMSGSNTLLRWLLNQSLLDELHLLVFPVVVGRGKRLLEGEGEAATMTLAESRVYSNGVLHLTYQTVAAWPRVSASELSRAISSAAIGAPPRSTTPWRPEGGIPSVRRSGARSATRRRGLDQPCPEYSCCTPLGLLLPRRLLVTHRHI